MKYSKEIKKAIKQIKYESEDNYIKDSNNKYQLKGHINMYKYPIGFYALYLKAKNKIIIFNYKIFESFTYTPKFLFEFNVDSNKENKEEIIMDILTREAINRNHIYDGNEYDYSRIEFLDHDRDIENEYLIDDIYFVNVVENKIKDSGIIQIIEG